jgi:hypothetical protein
LIKKYDIKKYDYIQKRDTNLKMTLSSSIYIIIY